MYHSYEYIITMRFLKMPLKILTQNVSLSVMLDLMAKKHKTFPWMTNGILRSINTINKLYEN